MILNLTLSILSVLKRNIAKCHKNFPKTKEKFDISFSFWPSMPLALTIIRCWNINHHSHIRHYIYHIYHFDHKVHDNIYVYGSNDWYFCTWRLSTPLALTVRLSNLVSLLYSIKMMIFCAQIEPFWPNWEWKANVLAVQCSIQLNLTQYIGTNGLSEEITR